MDIVSNMDFSPRDIEPFLDKRGIPYTFHDKRGIPYTYHDKRGISYAYNDYSMTHLLQGPYQANSLAP